MAQRSYRPPRNRRNNNSSIAIIAASILLIVVVAIVAWLLFGYKGSNNGTATLTSSAVVTVESSPTASITAQVTTASTAQATTSATASATEAATAIATATTQETPTPEATATVAPTPTPPPVTPTPLVGDYGPLPSADIPSGSPGAGRLQLDYHLNMSLQEIPQQAAVYSLQPRVWTSSDAATLAKSLGITGAVQDQGNGSFRASGNGELYISNSLVQYIAPPGGTSGTPTATALPANPTLVQTAHDWLITQNLLGAAIGPGSVTSRDENSNIAQVQFKPVEPNDLLSAIPSANITLGAGGTVTEAFVRWPSSMPRSTYGLRSAADLWSDASSGRGYVEVDDSALPSGTSALTGTATITSTSVAYTTAGSPETQQYLVPLVVFEGQATVQGSAAPIPIKIYVSAVDAQAAPRG